MWTKAESTIKPEEIDKTSSATIVYVRKNIVFVEATETKEAHYEWDEQTIPKADWALYEKLNNHDTEISECQDALIELSEIIGG